MNMKQAAELIEAANKLSFAAQTTGGTAGRDDNLVAAIDAYTKARDEYLAELSPSQEAPVAWMNPSDHDTGFTREKPDDMTGWYPLWTVPRFSDLYELAEKWLMEANEQPGELAFQVMGVQMRMCADQLKKILKSPLFRPFTHSQPLGGAEAAAMQQIEELAGIALATVVKGPDEDGDHWCGMCDAMLEDELSGHRAGCASRVLRDIFDIASRKHQRHTEG